MPLQLEGEAHASRHDARARTDPAETQRFRFINVKPRAPVPSLLRRFLGAGDVEYAYSDDELAFLSARDCDGFNRWEAVQTDGDRAAADD